MKTTRKLLLALVLVMSILMTLAVAVIPASAASSDKVRISGSWNSWGTDNNTTYDSASGLHYLKHTFEKGTYTFKVVVNGDWRGNGGNITGTVNGWDFPFYDNNNDCTLEITSKTTVIFQYNTNTKKLNVLYHNSHSWSDVSGTNTATCTAGGTKQQKCSVVGCGDTRNVTTSALNHDVKYNVCTRSGCTYQDKLVVAGNDAKVFGSAWSTTADANKMEYNTSTKKFTKVYTNVPAGNYAIKVAFNDKWDGAIGGTGNDGNYEFKVDGCCNATVTVTVYQSKISVSVSSKDTTHDFGDNSKCTVCGALRVYYYGDYSNVNCYVWNSSTNDKVAEWPGQTATKLADKIYYYDVPAGYTSIIFNNGSAQTDDLTIPDDGKVIYNSAAKTWVEHIWKDATCTAAKTCVVCGETDGEPAGHNTTSAATCTSKAVCSVCGEYGELAAHEYTYSCDAHCKNCGELTNEEASHTPVHVEAKAPICTENGNVEYWYCSVCEYAWLDVDCTIQTNLKAVVLGATCATNAVHNEGVEAGCTTTGLTENWYCANCDVYYLDAACTIVTNYKNLTIPAPGHSVGCGHAAEDAEGNLYGSVVEALSNGVSVTLVNNETVEELVINGAVLDLGGYTLTTKATIVFNGQIKGAGFLVVDKGNFSISDNATLAEVPVRYAETETTETYIFRVATTLTAEAPAGKDYLFRPTLSGYGITNNDIFCGSVNNNLVLKLRVTRTSVETGLADKPALVDIPDSIVREVYAKTSTGFAVTLTGENAAYTYSVEFVIVSCGVEVYSAPIAYVPKTNDED